MTTLAITADLHWGPHAAGNAATLQLAADLAERPADVLVLAGDVGAGDEFERCLELFANLPGQKALLPGNHDIWVSEDDRRGDSWKVYSEHLPRLCEQHGFHYLDHGPLLLPDIDLALVGSMNWYDYSWAAEPGWEAPPDWNERLREKRFTRGRHNDARFVRWTYTDASFTTQLVATFERQLDAALRAMSRAIVITHHPAFFGLNFPEAGPPSLDRMLWRAFSGNRGLEEVLVRHAERIPWVFSGHTHRMRENTLGPIRGVNIGGDYSWKRLLRLSLPGNEFEAQEFGPIGRPAS